MEIDAKKEIERERIQKEIDAKKEIEREQIESKVKLERERMKLKLDIASKNVGQNDSSPDNRHLSFDPIKFSKVTPKFTGKDVDNFFLAI